MIAPEFKSFESIPRLQRDCVITEKLDGTNSQVFFSDEGVMYVGSRNRWITPEDDNYGFARWAKENEEQLRTLGPGHHFGEWWGAGIQRRYGLTGTDKRFSMFNVTRWCLFDTEPGVISQPNPKAPPKMQQVLPQCCGLVPILYAGSFTTQAVEGVLAKLAEHGSAAAPGFMQPEGVVVFHEASGHLYKATLGNDGHKSVKAACSPVAQ